MAKKKTRAEAVIPMVPEESLKRLLNLDRRTSVKTAELNDDLREAVSNAVEHKHLHRGAFNITKRLFKMPDEKLAETMKHLEYMIDASGITERVEKVMRLPMGDDDKIDNVVNMQQAAE